MVNVKEMLARMEENRSKNQRAHEDLIAPVKAAINVLRDAGHPNTASQLEAQLFVIESLDTELSDMIRTNPMLAMEAIFTSISRS